jgi:hypothetical protein
MTKRKIAATSPKTTPDQLLSIAIATLASKLNSATIVKTGPCFICRSVSARLDRSPLCRWIGHSGSRRSPPRKCAWASACTRGGTAQWGVGRGDRIAELQIENSWLRRLMDEVAFQSKSSCARGSCGRQISRSRGAAQPKIVRFARERQPLNRPRHERGRSARSPQVARQVSGKSYLAPSRKA